MNWQGIVAIVAIIGLITTIIVNACTLAFFFGKFFAKFDGLTSVFVAFEKSFEKHMDREETQTKAMWAKIDGHGNILSDHSARIINLERKEERS